jgi:hypothetical protein
MGYTFPHRRSGTGRTPAHFGRRGQACWQPSPIIRGGSPAFIVLTSITSAPRKRAPESRRALGHLLGNGVRFGTATDVPLAGEGIKTVLSLKSVLPAMPVIAALSADHLAALDSPPSLVRLYIAGDREAAGRMAASACMHGAARQASTVRDLVPVWSEFNEDLQGFGPRKASDISDRPARAAR